MVIMEHLWNHPAGGSAHFEYSKLKELELLTLVADMMKWPSARGDRQGYNPGYDGWIGEKTFEVKFQSSAEMIIEYARYDGTPSGISLSTADYWLLVNRSSIKAKPAGKVRCLPTATLRDYVDQSIIMNNVRVYEPSASGPGSRNVTLDPWKLGDDGWMFDVPAILEFDKVIGYNLNLHSINQNYKRQHTL